MTQSNGKMTKRSFWKDIKLKPQALREFVIVLLIFFGYTSFFIMWIIFLDDYYTLDKWRSLSSIILPATFSGFLLGGVLVDYMFHKYYTLKKKEK